MFRTHPRRSTHLVFTALPEQRKKRRRSTSLSFLASQLPCSTDHSDPNPSPTRHRRRQRDDPTTIALAGEPAGGLDWWGTGEGEPEEMNPEKRGYKLQEFVAHDAEVRSLAIGKKSSRMFITGGNDRKVNLWAIGKQTPLLSLSGHTGSVECVQFDSAEVLVLAGSSNGSIKLWDLEEAKVVRSLTGHRSSCTAVEFHPFGEFFASGSSDTDLKIWDIKKKGCIHTYKGHRGAIRRIRFTPDGRWVVTGGDDNIVKVWDLTAGKLLHDFKFHSGQIHCIDFHPQEFLLATGSADRTVKFWDLETFELIGSAGPEGTSVRSMVFHPDGKALFCGLDQSLKVFSWEPVRCHDDVDMGWSHLADLSIYEGKLLGCSYHEHRVGLWVADISLIGPYALGVLPKANFFSELVHSMDDNPVKPIDSTANSSPALAMAHPKNSYKVKELGIAESRVRGSHLTPANTDKIKKDRSSTIPRRPDSSFKSSIQSSTPMRRMKLVDSPSTNPKTVERNFGQRDNSLTSRIGITNNSSTIKEGHLTESALVKDIYTTSQAVSAPVVVPRDILEDKTVGSICRGTGGTATVPDDFQGAVHTRKPSLSGGAADSDSSKEEYGAADKEHITEIAEKMDKSVSLEHPLQSNDDKSFESPCSTTETARVKYVRGVAVPLGKTKSLVERWEKREVSSIDCSPQTSSCGDREVRSDSPPSHLAEPSQTYEKDLSTDEVMTPINLARNHDKFINAVKLRLTKLEMLRHVFEQSGIKGAIAAMSKLPDNAVQADVVSALRGKLDLFNLEIFSSSLPVLAGLLSSKTERHATVSLEMLLDLIKIFGPVIHSTLSANSTVGVDIQAEQRLQRCTRCFNHLQKIRQVLHPLIMRGGQQAQLAQELSLSLQDLVVI
ncbi:katanin p80 WD40 repeat-containing subunit B1 homolog KTN80.1-like isoform X2 [Phragmites australis]|uniref:katanin p80 WD40 repeat-containing subunit B1 homolog KTN80.1-like isoform X2 n=1 Tax=Phragmites australis TaxID=29695 RepID=UPI002D79A3E9|nr:katanin p80 WD40 repeat-containing subunit B1 homolog KTN80.1-like isoform X2 [Phragmites australis]